MRALTYGMAWSIPAAIIAGLWFNNGYLLAWIVVPIIFFAAG